MYIDLRSPSPVAGANRPGPRIADPADARALRFLRETASAVDITVPDTFGFLIPTNDKRTPDREKVRADNTVAVLKFAPQGMFRSDICKMFVALNKVLPNRPFFTTDAVVKSCIAKARAELAAAAGPARPSASAAPTLHDREPS